MRKSEIVTCEQPSDNGTPGKVVTLKFQRLTIGQEEEFAEKLQDQILRESRRMTQPLSANIQIQVIADLAKSLTAGACSLTGDIGMQKCMYGWGQRLFLKLAATETHPEIDDETLYHLQNESFERLQEVMKSLAPAAQFAAMDEKRRAEGKA